MDGDAIETRAMRKVRYQRMVDKSESVTLADRADAYKCPWLAICTGGEIGKRGRWTIP
jgi:hypothetical protein